MVHPVWFAITIVIVAWYFITLTRYSMRWRFYPSHKFTKKLFWHSFAYRVLFGLIIMYVSQLTWDQPVYVGAVDAVTYHTRAILAAEEFAAFNFAGGFNFANVSGKIDDVGPGLFFGTLYTFTGGFYIFGMLFIAFLGTISVVYLYKTALIVYDDHIARTSALMYMHFPLALFYSSVTQKEGFVIFFLIMIVYIMTRSINGLNLKFVHIFTLIFCLISLFLFRAPVGLGCLVLVSAGFLINRYKGSYAASFSIGFISVGIFFVVMYYIGEIGYFIDRASTADRVGEARTAALVGSGEIEVIGLSIFDLMVAPIYLFMAVVAPFPAMVETGMSFYGFDQNYYNSPGRIVWNILAFFSIIGLWHTLRDRLFSSLMVWGFSIGYLYILIATVTFTRERFAYLGMPLLLILATVGIYKTKNKKLWYLYLAGLVGAILIWNTLRLGTRGLV